MNIRAILANKSNGWLFLTSVPLPKSKTIPATTFSNPVAKAVVNIPMVRRSIIGKAVAPKTAPV